MLAPASLIVGDSVSGQFFRVLSELLGAERHRHGYARQASYDHCRGPGCAALRSLPSYAQTAAVCNRSVWLAYIRNDWLDVAPSYPVPDGATWHCARNVDEYSPENRKALRKSTHLCGAPTPLTIECHGRLCLANGASPSPACTSTCALAQQNVSCGSRDDPCVGCSSQWAIPALCETVKDRHEFCSSTHDEAVMPPESETFNTAHCMPWSALSMLQHFRVIVLNAGAHRLPMHAYQTKIQQMSKVIQGYLRHNREGVAVFRATVPGFSGCNETHNTAPHASIAAAEEYLRTHPFYDQHEFVPLANRIAMTEMAKVGGHMLDVYPPSILRVDDRAGTRTYNGGLDCLHYRAPFLGTSLVLWAKMLGEMLLARGSRGAFDHGSK